MLKTVLLTFVTLVIAVGGGAGSVWLALENAPPIGAITAGPWTAFPHVGTPQADPYSRARFARQGGFPLGRSEGIAFTALRDSGGMSLRRSCTYRIEGVMPPARIWTLHAVDQSRALLPPLGQRRAALNSQMILYRPDGGLSITVSAHPAPGNWLPVTGETPMQLVLTLLDTPLSSSLQTTQPVFPQILRVACDA